MGTSSAFSASAPLEMRQTLLTLPELALVAGTRAAAGVGLGLLLADHVPARPRRAMGWTLVVLGVLSTVPLAITVFSNSRPKDRRL
jgi:multisubunit Na+/H+ antiporter MnhB subunit